MRRHLCARESVRLVDLSTRPLACFSSAYACLFLLLTSACSLSGSTCSTVLLWTTTARPTPPSPAPPIVTVHYALCARAPVSYRTLAFLSSPFIALAWTFYPYTPPFLHRMVSVFRDRGPISWFVSFLCSLSSLSRLRSLYIFSRLSQCSSLIARTHPTYSRTQYSISLYPPPTCCISTSHAHRQTDRDRHTDHSYGIYRN